tara:strand:+ start:297 stop:566 length:270 start_codon:yes stop_codon:yes gene_type:complete
MEEKTMKEKTIQTYNSFGKEITNTREQWVNRWKDCTVSSLAGLMPIEEYRQLKSRIVELASKDFFDQYDDQQKKVRGSEIKMIKERNGL